LEVSAVDTGDDLDAAPVGVLADGTVTGIDLGALAGLEHQTVGELQHLIVGAADELDGHGLGAVVGHEQADGLLLAHLHGREGKHAMAHIQARAIGIGMVLGDGMAHADDVAFHPDAGVVAAAVEQEHGFLGELAGPVVGIVGDGDTGGAAGTDGLPGELRRGASAPGVDIADGDDVAGAVGEGEGVAHLAVGLADGAEVVDALVVLECLKENRFLSSAHGKAQE